MQALPALVQPVHVYDEGLPVQTAFSVIDAPTSGVVSLALTLHNTPAAGGGGVAGKACQLTEIFADVVEPVLLAAATAYVLLPAAAEVATHVDVELVHPVHT